MYTDVEGVEQDLERARYWFQKSAEQGYPKAQESLDKINSLGWRIHNLFN